MKKGLLILVLIMSIAITAGCGRKDKEHELSLEQEQMMTEEQAQQTLPSEPAMPPAQEVAAPVELPQEAAPAPEATPWVPISPRDIQQALRNAGFYHGEIDGKIGPKSKQAIRDFQKQRNLKVDGKVGPKTWANLKEYLNPAVSTEPAPAGGQ